MLFVSIYTTSNFPVNEKKIIDRAKRTLKLQDISDAQLEISIVGEKKIQRLNEDLVGHKGVTDVLSFPQHDKNQLYDVPLPENVPPHLGDIVVCFPVALKEAKKFGRMVDEQIGMYIEHSVLHLLGYHHE